MKLLTGLLLTIAYRCALLYWRITRPNAFGAFVAVWHEGQVMTIKNSYKPQWTFPGGGIKSTESPVEAATRELREEVGIRVESTALKVVEQFICHSEFKKDHATAFEVKLESKPDFQIDGFEVVDAQFVDFDKLCSRRNEFTEAVNCYIDWKLRKIEARK